MNPFAIRFDDGLNAILVKELRQTVRGKFLWSIFNLFLAIMTITISMSLSEDRGNNGGNVVAYLFTFLYFAAFFLVPLYVGKKVNSEKYDGTNELLSITTMSAKSIVMGKFLCGLVIVTMLYCAFAPFMSLTVLMGGLDTHDLVVMTILSYSFCLLGILLQIAIGLEALGVAALGVAVKIFGVILHISLFSASITACLECLNGKNFHGYSTLLACLLAEYIVGVIIFYTAVTFLQPDTANKSYTMRKYLSILWFIGAGAALLYPNSPETFFIAALSLLAFVSCGFHREPDYYSERIIKDIPQGKMARFFKFTWFTGLANGFGWVLLFTVFSVLVLATITPYSGTYYHSSKEHFGIALVIFIATINAFGFLGNPIRKFFFKGYSRGSNILIGAVLYLVTGWLPMLVVGILGGHGREFREMFFWINPVYATFDGEFGIGLTSSLILLGLGLLFNSKALIRQTKNYFAKIANEEEVD